MEGEEEAAQTKDGGFIMGKKNESEN